MEKMPVSTPEPKKEQKERKVEDMIEGEPDAVFILTGAMKFNEKRGEWESGTYKDRDQNSSLVTGGKDRVIAAAEIHKYFPDTTIVPMSRTRDEEKPTYAEVMERELKQKNVPEENILIEDESKTTIESLKAIVDFTSEHRWKSIVLLSSGYHLPRIGAMVKYLPEFSDTDEERTTLQAFSDRVTSGDIQIQLVSSDEVLMARDDHYKKYFKEVYDNPDYQKKAAQELKATRQVLEERNYGPYSW